MIVGTKQEFEGLAQFVLDDYLASRSQKEMFKAIDIQDFATNYLRMDISYQEFEPNSRIAGMRIGNQIILDVALSNPSKEGIRNFTVAHECGHELINCQDENYQPNVLTDFRSLLTDKKKELQTEEDFKEWQANVVAAYLLMPPLLMGWCFYTFARMKKITIYGDYLMTKNDRGVVNGMKKYLKVSKEALIIRLNQLNMLEFKPIQEYYEKIYLF